MLTLSRNGFLIHTFTQTSAIVGRADGCSPQLVLSNVSRHHCRVFKDRGQWYVEDLGSRNGTYVNGVSVDSRPRPLHSGDDLTIGGLTYRVATECATVGA